MQQATLSFHDASPGHGSEIVSKLEETYSHGSTSDVPLGEFLKRPVLISTTEWGSGSNYNFTILPWNLFFSASGIQEKVEGFRFVRGNLKLRFVVTGNPFLFGRVIAAYEPFANRGVWSSPGNYGNTNQKVYKSVLSQMPHIYLDAATSQGGEMTLPFFSPYNWIDITSFDSFVDMGTLRMTNLTPLSHANAPSGKIQILVYAWMDDAELCVPTAASFSAENYQGTDDEFSSGLISKPASAISRVAGMLAKIPIFEPYALPTEMAAKAIGSAASHFGFSRPPILDNIVPTRHRPFGDLAATNTHEIVHRLALDAKSQLTIDPRTVGLDGTDEMSLSYIVQRESLLNSFEWDESNVVGNRIVSFRVGPTYHTLDTTSLQNRNAIPPCTAVASMFRFWRGSMVYRFSIVASALHRGKIRISYEPTSSATIGESQTVYSRIIDLAETRDFELPVLWHQPTPWQKVLLSSLGDASDTHYYSSTPTATGGAINAFNGNITITVLTPLTSPDPSLALPVHILFYARGGPDLEFAAPVNTDLPFTYRSTDVTEQPQGRTELDEAEENTDAPPFAENTIDAIGDHPGSLSDPLTHVFMGETVSSIRSYLKRYRREKPAITSTLEVYPSFTRSSVRMPILDSYMSQKEFIMNWYAGWRGSTRFKVGSGNAARQVYSEFAYQNQTAFNLNGHAGVIVNEQCNEIEVPFYSYKRFALARTNPTWIADSNIDSTDPNNSGAISAYNGAEGGLIAVDYSATGEDFSLFFFLGIPPVFVIP